MAHNARRAPSLVPISTRFYAQHNAPSTWMLITSFNQNIAFVVPVLIAFLQLKYQGINDQNKSPFATHPTTMLVAISSFVVYCLANIALPRFLECRRLAVLAGHCLVWSGYASVASLVAILFPDSVSPFVYAIFLMMPTCEMLYWLYHKLVADEDGAEFQFQSRHFRRFLNNSVWRVLGNSPGQWPQILPI